MQLFCFCFYCTLAGVFSEERVDALPAPEPVFCPRLPRCISHFRPRFQVGHCVNIVPENKDLWFNHHPSVNASNIQNLSALSQATALMSTHFLHLSPFTCADSGTVRAVTDTGYEVEVEDGYVHLCCQNCHHHQHDYNQHQHHHHYYIITTTVNHHHSTLLLLQV